MLDLKKVNDPFFYRIWQKYSVGELKFFNDSKILNSLFYNIDLEHGNAQYWQQILFQRNLTKHLIFWMFGQFSENDCHNTSMTCGENITFYFIISTEETKEGNLWWKEPRICLKNLPQHWIIYSGVVALECWSTGEPCFISSYNTVSHMEHCNVYIAPNFGWTRIFFTFFEGMLQFLLEIFVAAPGPQLSWHA